ncbi:hypothetical protein HW555_007510 [Spodoptera exigua]|uniref:Uncharacterized protein n=1 Tax=Spodoptera exigua TaxID=7107 RepID=A0A835GCN3_SPOEX|nr:hypothetical protein HW555_007510 [Spodoptera exigua]
MLTGEDLGKGTDRETLGGTDCIVAVWYFIAEELLIISSTARTKILEKASYISLMNKFCLVIGLNEFKMARLALRASLPLPSGSEDLNIPDHPHISRLPESFCGRSAVVVLLSCRSELSLGADNDLPKLLGLLSFPFGCNGDLSRLLTTDPTVRDCPGELPKQCPMHLL